MATVHYNSTQDDLNSSTQGWTGTRIFTVTGLTPDTPGAMIYAARVAIAAHAASGYTDIGKPHPTLSNAYCSAIDGQVVNTTTVQLYARYSQRERMYGGGGSGAPETPPAHNTTQSSAAGDLYSIEDNHDRDGEIVKVQHAWVVNEQYGITEEEKITKAYTDEQSCILQVLRPSLAISHTQLETTTHAALLARYKDYIGKLNLAGFLLDSNAEAGTWMMTNMSWSTTQSATTDTTRIYEVIYTFQWRKEGWKQRVIYISPYSGRPLKNSSIATGEEKMVTLYEWRSFSALPLSWSPTV